MAGIAIYIKGANFSTKGLGKVTFATTKDLESITVNVSDETEATELVLGVEFSPVNASDKEITWEVTDGGTDVSLSGDSLTINKTAYYKKIHIKATATNDESISDEKDIIVAYPYSDSDVVEFNDSEAKSVIISKKYSGYTDLTFAQLKAIDSIQIGNTGVFGGNTAIENLDVFALFEGIGDTITYNTFRNMTSLKSITFPQQLTSIGDGLSGTYGVFSNDTALVSVILRNVKSIGQYAFYNCAALNDIDLSYVEVFGDSSFAYCNSLTEIHLKSVKTIGDSVFKTADDTLLTKVVIEEGNEKLAIGPSFLQGRKGLLLVDFPSNVVSIGHSLNLSSTNSQTAFIFRATTPPTFGDGSTEVFRKTPKAIYVPDDSVDTYKAATGWSTWASYIKPLSEYTE